MQLDPTGDPTRTLRIAGSDESIENAKGMIERLLSIDTFTYGDDRTKPLKTVQIPSKHVGFIVGKGGSTITRIIKETGCVLQIESEEDAIQFAHIPPIPGHHLLHFVGTMESVTIAERAVVELLKSRYKSNSAGGDSHAPQHQLGHEHRAMPCPETPATRGCRQVVQFADENASSGMQGYGNQDPRSANPYLIGTLQAGQKQAADAFAQSLQPRMPQRYSPYLSQRYQAPASVHSHQQTSHQFQPRAQIIQACKTGFQRYQ